MILKIWELNRNFFDENDLKWCSGLDIIVDVKRDFTNFSVIGSNHNFKIAGRLQIKLSTITEKQESALLLKYGTDLFLTETRLLDIKL